MTESIQTTMSEATGRDSLGRAASPLLFLIRLAIAAVQGLALWWLYRSISALGMVCNTGAEVCAPGTRWPGTVPELFAPLLLIFFFVPVLLQAGVGHMRVRTLTIWTIAVAAILTLLGWHDVARQSAGTLINPPFFTPPLFLFSAAALFIGHHLILPADLERRWIAAFPTYFDTAWKAGVQLGLSIGFTGAFWLLLLLGALLFQVIGLDFLLNLLSEEWFWIPVTCLVFAVAVHLTDVRDGLIRGVRTVVLMLLSWLLLVMTVLVAGFLVALPFTGLAGLWNTGSATALVLSASAALIILINTAYQDGRPDNLPPAVLRIAVRVAAVLITPLVILAFWGLALRIGQHGLTPDRIIALACAIVGLAHAVGYGLAALRPFWQRDAAWMTPLERTNVWTAVLAVALILALFSPLADPTRLSVNDQVSRLERGAVAVDQFDFRFLRFESGKAGLAALDKLGGSTDPRIATLAKTSKARTDRYAARWEGRAPISASDLHLNIAPSSRPLPASFQQQLQRLSNQLAHCADPKVCGSVVLDLDGDGRLEVLVAGETEVMVFQIEDDGRWFEWVNYRQNYCLRNPKNPGQALRQGRFETARPRFPDLLINGERFQHQEGYPECPEELTSSPR